MIVSVRTVVLFTALVLCSCGQCQEDKSVQPANQAKNHALSADKEPKGGADNSADILATPRDQDKIDPEFQDKGHNSSNVPKRGDSPEEKTADNASEQLEQKKTRKQVIFEMVTIIESVPPWYKGAAANRLHLQYQEYGDNEKKSLIEAAKKIQGYYRMRTTSSDEQFFPELREAIITSIKNHPAANYNEIKGKLQLLLSMIFSVEGSTAMVFDAQGRLSHVLKYSTQISGPAFDPVKYFDEVVSHGYAFRDLE